MCVRILYLAAVGAFAASSVVAQTEEPAPESQPKMGDVFGPLALSEVERTYGWISVAWNPNVPPAARRMVDKVSGVADNHVWLNIQLDCIQAKFSSDPIDNDDFRRQYNDGVKTLLAKQRPFWFKVTNTLYAGPGQVGGIFILDDEWWGSTIQQEMVRCGYAVAGAGSGYTDSSGRYGPEFHDTLLRLEGAAAAYQIGIWKPRVDPSSLTEDQAIARLERVTQDSEQPFELRQKTLQLLFEKGDQNNYLDQAISFASLEKDPIQKSELFRSCVQHCQLNNLSEANKRKFLHYAYGLLEQVNDGHGSGSFLAVDIGRCIGVTPIKNEEFPFIPDKTAPKYRDRLGNMEENYAQDTVNNALKWWAEHKAQYQ